MGDTFSGCEIIELAIQIEKNGKDFFRVVSEQAKNEEAKKIFHCLSEEDSRHADNFKELFTLACNYNPEGAYPDEYFAYMNSLASNYVFTEKDKGVEIAKEAKNEKEAIEIGIRYVKDAILFYEGMRRIVAEKDKEIVDNLLKEEKQHLNKLCKLKQDI